MDIKQFRLFEGLTKIQKAAVISFAVIATIYDFFYIHWISYRIARTHLESEIFYPEAVAILAALILVVVWIIDAAKKEKTLTFIKYLLVIVIVAGLIAAHFCGFCPACNEVHDPVYKFIFKLIHGYEYEFV